MRLIFGCVAFAIFWVLAVFPAVPFLPIGRTAGSLLGAMLMVFFQVLTPEEAFAAINLPILGLLFGTMVVSVFLERADMFKYLGKLLSWKSKGGKDLLCRICVVSAAASALFTNDTCCVVLTEFILKVARQNNLPPQPFLLALASSANIGSATTPIGNPQNLVIAVQSRIPFNAFLFGLLPAMAVGVCVNIAILLFYFSKSLSTENHQEEIPPPAGDVIFHRFSPATMSNHHLSSRYSNDTMAAVLQGSLLPTEEGHLENPRSNIAHGATLTDCLISHEKDVSVEDGNTLLWNTLVYLVTIGMLVALLMGVNMSWSAISAALVLIVLDFKDAQPCLDKVSYSLLIFFCGMFITIDGFNKTGLPSLFWELMEPYARIDTISGVVVLSLVILLLSNIASNVPTGKSLFPVKLYARSLEGEIIEQVEREREREIESSQVDEEGTEELVSHVKKVTTMNSLYNKLLLDHFRSNFSINNEHSNLDFSLMAALMSVLLLGARVAASAAAASPAEEKRAWLVLAWVSTVAGNLSLLGSAANLIVCEQARRAQFGYHLSFLGHLRFGLPSTLVITAVGLLLIRS